MTEVAWDFRVKNTHVVFPPGNVFIDAPCRVQGSLEVQVDLTVSGALIVHGLPHGDRRDALTVIDPVTRETGRVTGLTAELRPIVTWASGQVRSRSWSDLVLGDGRAW